jgi:membrane protein implicated in regulation of membrane protease activity
MIILIALTVGLVWWIAAWAFGIKSFDAFLLTAALVVTAAAIVLLRPFLDRVRGREPGPSEEPSPF